MDNASALVAYRHRSREEPAKIAVTASQRIGILPRLAAIVALPNARVDTFDMVRMNKLLPVVVQGHSCIIVPSLVEPGSPTARIGRPSELAHVVGKLAKSSFAFRERRFGPLALRDFLGNDIDAKNGTGGVFQRMQSAKHARRCHRQAAGR